MGEARQGDKYAWRLGVLAYTSAIDFLAFFIPVYSETHLGVSYARKYHSFPTLITRVFTTLHIPNMLYPLT